MRSRTLFVSAVLAAMLVPATLAAQEKATAEDATAVTVKVENGGWLAVHVYAVQSGVSTSLGMVESLSDARFTLPRSLAAGASPVRLLADPVGGAGYYVTDRLLFDPGDEITLRLREPMSLSSIDVRPRTG